MRRRIFLGSAVVALALVMLAVSVRGSVWAQSPQGASSGGCVPGSSSYHSDCDVNQDGKIDVQDLQLVAARWKQTGTPNGHFGERWSGSTLPAGLEVDNNSPFDGAKGLVGVASGTDGWNYGVEGRTDSPWANSSGVYGEASATSGETHGVYGRTDSTSSGASGVYGYATQTSGQTYGVYGKSSSSD